MESKRTEKNDNWPYLVKGIGSSTMELIKDAMSGEMQYLTLRRFPGGRGWPTRQHTVIFST